MSSSLDEALYIRDTCLGEFVQWEFRRSVTWLNILWIGLIPMPPAIRSRSGDGLSRSGSKNTSPPTLIPSSAPTVHWKQKQKTHNKTKTPKLNHTPYVYICMINFLTKYEIFLIERERESIYFFMNPLCRWMLTVFDSKVQSALPLQGPWGGTHGETSNSV